MSAAVSGPIGSWLGRRVERAKYEAEVGKIRAELNDKIAEVKSHELEKRAPGFGHPDAVDSTAAARRNKQIKK